MKWRGRPRRGSFGSRSEDDNSIRQPSLFECPLRAEVFRLAYPLAKLHRGRVYVAEKAGTLMPSDVQGRTRVIQWCFAASSTVEPILTCIDLVDIFDSDKAADKVKEGARKIARRFLGDVERRLEEREWIACADFTVADIMMAGVLRTIRKTDLIDPFPRMKAYYERCVARPAWQRTLGLYAERLGVRIHEIR